MSSEAMRNFMRLIEEERMHELKSPRSNAEMVTFGGKVHWRVLIEFKGWKIQKNKYFCNCRIIDPANYRTHWSFTEKEMEDALENLNF